MSDGPALDTDVLLKAAIFRSAQDFLTIMRPFGSPGALGLTHLISPKQLARNRNIRNLTGAVAELSDLLAGIERLEPDEDEIRVAAELTAIAQVEGLPLDTGEAQLTAVVINRCLPLLISGDKRAIGALARLIENNAGRMALLGRVVCFEQVIISVASFVGEHEIRRRVCDEPDVDGALRLACSCGSDDWEPKQLEEACISFIESLRKSAGDLICEGLSFT